MSTQIAVRLPDAVVAFLDELVATGQAPSRAAVVSRALERELRLRAARADAAVLGRVGPGDDLDDLVAWATAHPLDPEG